MDQTDTGCESIHRAYCGECDWVGPWRDSRREALEDEAAHECLTR